MKRFRLALGIGLLLVANGGVAMAQREANAAWIGLVATYEDVEKPAEGRMTVVKVYPESPAAAAGLRVGDVIQRVNGVTFRFPDWTATVANGGPFAWAQIGDHLRLTVARGERTETIEIVAASPPPAIVEERRKFRATLAERRGPEIFDLLARRGAVIRVSRKVPDGPVSVAAEGLSAEEEAALSAFLDAGRLRLLFTRVVPGQEKRFQLALDPASGETRIDPVP